MTVNPVLLLSKIENSTWSYMEPEFYGDLVYKCRQIVGKPGFSDHFSKIVVCYKRKGYIIDAIKQSACSAANPIMADNFAYLFNCTPVVRVSEYDCPNL